MCICIPYVRGEPKQTIFQKFKLKLFSLFDIERLSIYKTVVFFIWNKAGVLHVPTFKYFLRLAHMTASGTSSHSIACFSFCF